jgi:hypothetical protein
VQIGSIGTEGETVDILDWKINNNRNPERIMRHSTAFESQVRLAEAGHWRFLNSRRREVEARRREPASGGGGTGGGGSGGGGKGKGKRAAEEAPSSSGLPRARGGEKRGLSDIDETDVVHASLRHSPLTTTTAHTELTTHFLVVGGAGRGRNSHTVDTSSRPMASCKRSSTTSPSSW